MSFKQKLKQLLDSSYDPSKDIDKNFNLEILNTKRLLRKNESDRQLYKKQNNLVEDYQLFNSIIHCYKSFNKFKNNKNEFFFSIDKFKNEKSIPRLNSLIRSCSLKDLHNKRECLNLNRSYSNLDINETERNNSLMRKKIENTRKYIGLTYKDKKLFINKPIINLKSGLTKFQLKNIINSTPKNRLNINNKRFINYPKSKVLKEIKSNSVSNKDSNKRLKSIDNISNYVISPRNSNSSRRLFLFEKITKN